MPAEAVGHRMDKSIHSKEYAVFLRHLRQARKKAGMTQEQLARRLAETQSFVSKCERGERRGYRSWVHGNPFR